eukprot:8830055-Pyramimonas_sp.AAC.1
MPDRCAAQLSAALRRWRCRAALGAWVAVAHARRGVPRADWAASDRRESGRTDQGHRLWQQC